MFETKTATTLMGDHGRFFDQNARERVAPHLVHERRYFPTMVAQLATELLRSTVVMAVPVEDRSTWSSTAAPMSLPEPSPRTYQEFRLMTPGEAVDRACDAAQLLHEQFSKRGWLLEVPAYDEMVKRLSEDVQDAGFK